MDGPQVHMSARSTIICKAVPADQIEAASAYGMSRFTLYRRIVLPSALRRALPFFSNEVILMLQTADALTPDWACSNV